jgi:hypothetical protein
VAGGGKLEEKREVPWVISLLLNIVELDPQPSVTWYLDAGRGVKYRILPFGISEGLYNVLFILTAGRERPGYVRNPIQSKVFSTVGPICPGRRCCVNRVCRDAGAPFEPKDLLSSEILLIL